MADHSHNPQPLPGLRNAIDRRSRLVAAVIAAVALAVFGFDLAGEPHFVDESAYLSQSFYWDLLIGGKRDDPAWLNYPGYDLPPLPKYIIGAALWLEGYPRPGPAAARAWYLDNSRRFVPPQALVAARRPSVVFGAIGCVAIFALGSLAVDGRVGVAAAVALMANPLYRMHARRAMSDVPSESMILVTAAIGLWAWQRLLAGRSFGKPWLVLVFGGGGAAGLAVLSKLNGALGGFVLAAWAALALLLESFRWRGRIGFTAGCTLAGVVAFVGFVLLNPFMTAHPTGPLDPEQTHYARMNLWDRAQVIRDHRTGVSDEGRRIFPHNALNEPIERIKAVAVQGFGRFGPFGPTGRTDSTRRYDWAQDRGALVWLPSVAIGFVLAVRIGKQQLHAGEPPTASAVALQAVVALATITAFIPLAWDRYFLSIQPGSALLGGIALVGVWDGVHGVIQNRWRSREVAS